MTALTLPFPTVPAAELAVRSGWAVVDGEFCCLHAPDVIERYRGYGIDVDDRTRPCLCGPPPEWVRAAGRCERCEGDGLEGVYGMNRPPCHACLGVGKPRVEVTAPCVFRDDCAAGANTECVCTTHDGSIHVAWVTVTEVLRVEDALKPDTTNPDEPAVQFQLMPEPTMWLWRKVDHLTNEWDQWDITADVAHLGPPETLIGKWLLKLESANDTLEVRPKPPDSARISPESDAEAADTQEWPGNATRPQGVES